MIYAIVIFSITITPVGYSIPVSMRMADAVPDETFAAEYAFHQAYDFWVCTTAIKAEPARPTRRRIIQSLERYGFRDTFEYEPDSESSSAGTTLCSESRGSPPTLLFTLDNEAISIFR
jgi:hypothetical protein